MTSRNGINTDLVISVTRGGTGASTFTSNGVLLGNGTSAISALAALTNGQIIIGSTGSSPVPSTLTSGTSISISSIDGSITINDVTADVPWLVITLAQVAVNRESYITNGIIPVVITLPLDGASSIGDQFAITTGTQQWVLAQNASDRIQIRNSTTTIGTLGSLASSALGDTIYVIKRATNMWQVVSYIGTITVV